jgi:DNA-binding response OmpR family regulator
VTTPPMLVFVVEDDELIRDLVEEALIDGGFAVARAITGDEAIALLNTDGADYSALVTDVNLPGEISGWDIARRAREINDKLPVIYMTGGSAHEWASRGVPNSPLMPKPFAVAQVVTSVSQLINAAVNLA